MSFRDGYSSMLVRLLALLIVVTFTLAFQQMLFAQIGSRPVMQEFPVPSGSHPHDVAPAKNGSVWYTAQRSGELGILNPTTAPWITDGGLNAIVRVDPNTENVTLFPLPDGTGSANLNTATYDHNGILWFTGQSGIYGRLDPELG